MIYRDNGNERRNKWDDKAHLRIIAPLPSGANIAKIKSATGNVHVSTSRTVGAPHPRAQRSYSVAQHIIYYTYSGYVLNIYRARHGGRRATADHGGPRRGTADRRTRILLCTMECRGPCPLPGLCLCHSLSYDYWCMGMGK